MALRRLMYIFDADGRRFNAETSRMGASVDRISDGIGRATAAVAGLAGGFVAVKSTVDGLNQVVDDFREGLIEADALMSRFRVDDVTQVDALNVLADVAGLGDTGARDMFDLVEQASSKAGDVLERRAAGNADPRVEQAFTDLGLDPEQLYAASGPGALDYLVRSFRASPYARGEAIGGEANIGEILGGGDIDVIGRLANVYEHLGDDVLRDIAATLEGDTRDTDWTGLTTEAYESRLLRSLAGTGRDYQQAHYGPLAGLGARFDRGSDVRREVFGVETWRDAPAGYALPGDPTGAALHLVEQGTERGARIDVVIEDSTRGGIVGSQRTADDASDGAVVDSQTRSTPSR